MQDAITFAAGVAECEVETKMHKNYTRATASSATTWSCASPPTRSGGAASSRATAFSGGAADANVFNERGLQCVNLANGMAEIHTPDEHIAVADLDAMVDVTLALVDVALGS